MVKLDPTIQTLTFAGVIAIAISVLVNGTLSSHSQERPAPATSFGTAVTAPGMKPVWAASATGRVEPKEGEIRIVAQSPGRIVDVAAKSNDKVSLGDLLVRVDDADLWSKLDAAKAEEAVRIRERDEESAAKGAAEERRKGEDAVAAAERAVFVAREALDQVAAKVRAGSGTADDVAASRSKLADAKSKFTTERAALERVNTREEIPLPTRLESALTLARADVSQVVNAIERTRVRAPSDGTVLNVWAKVGEMAAPTPEAALVLFGDVSGLRVRTEVEERDVVKVRAGQKVVIRADAYPDKDFEGVVSLLAPALGPPRILSRGPRRPNDVEVLEVMVSLDGNPPLLTGMRVDVFFKHESPAT